jgi:hypothetical protein
MPKMSKKEYVRLRDGGAPYRLPDGDVTDSWAKYQKAWLSLAQPIRDATGYELLGMIPGLTFFKDGEYVELSVPFAKALIRALKGKRRKSKKE